MCVWQSTELFVKSRTSSNIQCSKILVLVFASHPVLCKSYDLSSHELLSIYLSIHLSIYLFISLFIYLSIYLSLYISIYLSIYLSVFQWPTGYWISIVFIASLDVKFLYFIALTIFFSPLSIGSSSSSRLTPGEQVIICLGYLLSSMRTTCPCHFNILFKFSDININGISSIIYFSKIPFESKMFITFIVPYACVCVCIYIYIVYMCIHTYIHTHTIECLKNYMILP